MVEYCNRACAVQMFKALSVRCQRCKICANAHNSGNYETRLKCSQDWSRLGFVSASPQLQLDYALASISSERCRSSRNNSHYAPRHIIYYNTWINKSRDWRIDGVAKKISVWFFMSTNLQNIPVKISCHSDVWSTSYSDLSGASIDILKTMDSKQFRVLIYHCFLMKKNTV